MPARAFLAVCAALALGFVLVLVVGDAALAGHQPDYCVDCSWWNVVCRLGNWLDGC